MKKLLFATLSIAGFLGIGATLNFLPPNAPVTAYGTFIGSGSGLTNLNASQLTGTMPAGSFPALTGDITTSAGSVATTLKTSPTIVTPTIASFVNATHTHQNAAGGGTLDAAAIASGTVAAARQGSITNHSDVTVAGTAPTPGDVLRWSGTAWTNGPPTGYTIDLYSLGNNTMAANTSYFYGKMSTRTINTVYSIAQIDIPKAGTIKRVQYKWDISSTLASSENVNFWIEVNNSTDVLNYSGSMTNAVTNVIVTGSQAVSVGDTIVLKITTPSTWTTPANSVRLVAQVYIE